MQTRQSDLKYLTVYVVSHGGLRVVVQITTGREAAAFASAVVVVVVFVAE